MQDKYSALTEEFTEFKKQAAAKIDKAKHSGGTIDPAQLAEISAKANADANAVIDDAHAARQTRLSRPRRHILPIR